MKIYIKNQEYYKIVLDTLSKLGYSTSYMPESSPYSVFANNDDMDATCSSKEYFTSSNIPEYELVTSVSDNKVIYEFVEVKRKKQWKYAITDDLISSYLTVVDAQDNTIIGYAMDLLNQKTISGLKQAMENSNYDITSLEFDDHGALIIR